MNDCTFCKIISGEIPCHKIYEDKDFLAFLDIQPVSHGHVLIIPKKHIVWMYEVDDKTIADIFILTKKLMLTVKKSMECDYVQEWVSGEEIPHFHVHILPKYSTDNTPGPKRKKYEEGEAEKIIKKITEAF